MDFGRPLGELIPQLAAGLAASETPRLDIQVLLAHLLERPRSWLLAHPEARLDQAQQAALHQALQALQSGTPLPYLLGHWAFFGLDFLVSPAVLIPRPETELLVERALTWLDEHPDQRQAADVGTGSGCIAVALANRVPDLWITATDISTAALEIARQNVARHSLQERITCLQADLLPPGVGGLNLICANLPYIPTETLQALHVSRYEPQLALDGGPDGLRLVQRLLVQAQTALATGGLILLEIEANCGQSALQLIYDYFPTAKVQLHQDLAGRDRLVSIENH